MSVIAVVGAQWGDEGKGKIVDMLAEKASMVIRFSGGPNAGHTVHNPYGEFSLHLVPSGIFYPHTACIIGSGVVVSPSVLLDELEQLWKKGVNTSKLLVSTRAHLIMPYHIILDRLEEQAKGAGALGTTRSGVGPAYADKVARLGIRAGDLADKEGLLRRLRFVLEQKNLILTRIHGAPPLSVEEVYDQLCQYADRLAAFIRETEPIISQAVERNEPILLEGAQGTLLDIDFGTYPYVTSSSVIAAGAFAGAGLHPVKMDHILGIMKAYTTRVGAGPMPTELGDETGERIRQIAQEYGVTTGRPRRCGWFDAVATRYSALINGFSGVALTRLDVLDAFDSIKVCTKYKADGKIIDQFPSSTLQLERCQPVYDEVPGWQSPTAHLRRFQDLPPLAQSYVRKLEHLVGCPINIISVGPHREQTIVTKAIL
ncbi:MAG: adenylosuccinate synthase [Chloroflexi bacterium RBG_13_53_26]|nr:MAG: adenylosuccinate synthase [Chloroflexi bacterium RBG_13_53_26]